MDKSDVVDEVMRLAPVIPVIVIDEPKAAVELARALVAGGLPAIEITLRTPRAIDCIKAVAENVEAAVAGAGTVLGAAQVGAVEKAGARFMVSPGTSPGLLDAADDTALPLLPGIATASEAMALGERGYRRLKFFPAEPAGGAAYLASLASPLPDFRFCPTGGIGPGNAADYLGLDNVLCVGGSWVAPGDLLNAGAWEAITGLAREAVRLSGPA